MANRISTLIDFDTRGGVRSISQLRSEIKSTDGAFAKMKVGAKGMGDTLKANVGPAAIAAGASLVAFGVKAVGSFTDAAIAAGNFADSTGTSVEQASQWLSVADDLGLSGDTLQKSFLKMNKTIGDGGPIVEKYGLSLQTTADGAADVNGTMLKAIEVIGGIKDPTERATAAQEVFGRSYAEVAEIVLGNADDIRAGLESTSDAQIIDEAELQKAREYRAAMDQLNDVFTDITMTVGSALTPALTDTAEQLTEINSLAHQLNDLPGGDKLFDFINPGKIMDSLDFVTKLGAPFRFLTDPVIEGGFKRLGSALGFAGDKGDEFFQSVGQAADAAADGKRQMDDYASALEESGSAQINTNGAIAAGARQMDEYVTALEKSNRASQQAITLASDLEGHNRSLKESFSRLRKEISEKRELEDLTDLFGEVEEAAADAWDSAAEGSDEAVYKADVYDRKLDDLRLAVLDYGEGVGALPDEQITEVLAMIDEGRLAEVEATLAQLERARTTRLDIISYYKTVGSAPSPVGSMNGPRARGGPTFAGLHPVIEQGPELLEQDGKTYLMSSGGGNVVPLGKGTGSGSLGSSIVINVTAGMGANGAEIGRVIRDELLKLKRANGSLGLS